MKRFFISLFVIFCSLALVNSPTRAKAATLSENETIRLGIAGIGYGLEHFGYVLPSPNQIEALGGFSEYAKIIGERIVAMNHFDDWYEDNDILSDLFAPITFGYNLGLFLGSLFDEERFYELFGFEVSGDDVPNDLIHALELFQIYVSGHTYSNYVFLYNVHDLSYSFGSSNSDLSIAWGQGNLYVETLAGSKVVTLHNSTPNSYDFVCIYYGASPAARPDLTWLHVAFIPLADVGSEPVSFEPSLSPYSGSYHIDIGDSYYYPSVFYNNYGTIYDNVQKDNFYDAVIYITNDPDNPDSEEPPSIKPIGSPSGPSLGGVDFDLGQPLFVKPYLQRFFSESYDFVVFVHDSIWASGIDYVFYAILICGIMGGIISKILH